MTHTRDFPLEIKSFDDGAGVFEGYASVFGVLDSYGEKVAPGAFVDSLARHRRDGTAPIMLWHHNPGDVIGVWTDIAEDGKGLRVVGRLLKGVRRADESCCARKRCADCRSAIAKRRSTKATSRRAS